MEDHSIVYDNEQFALDDDITRRLIYRPIGTRNEFESCYAYNFVASCFEDGATQWSHLKEPYATFYYKMTNLMSFAIGNKQIGSIIHPNVQKKMKITEASPIVSAASRALDQWYGKCRNKDSIVVRYETLFDADITNKVVGIRVWLHSRITMSTTKAVSSTLTAPVISPIQQPNEHRVPVDVLSAAMRHSLQEASALSAAYISQRAKYIAMKNRSKRQVTSRQMSDTALYPLYNYINHETPLKCFSNIFRRYLHTDPSRISGNLNVTYPAFKDSRPVMDLQYNVEDEANAANLARNTFSKEAAMFYLVRTANITPEQRNINNYVRITDRVPVYDPDALTDVLQLVHFGIKDSSITTYYNEQTTYQLRNEQISPEFFHTMPLTHRMGAQLPTRQKVGIVADLGIDDNLEPVSLGDSVALKPSRRLTALAEDDDDNEEEEEREKRRGGEDNDSSTDLVTEPIPDYVDEEWLADNDLDGTYAQKIFDKPRSYGYTETVLKPLGLHQVVYTVDARRMLACKSASFSPKEIENPDEDFKKRFIEKRKEYIACILPGNILQGGGKLASQHRLLACDHASTTGTMNQNGSITPSSNIDTLETGATNEVYRASTLNYIVGASPMNAKGVNGKDIEEEKEEEEEETIHLDEDEENDAEEGGGGGQYDLDGSAELPGFRAENGDFMGNQERTPTKKPRFASNRQLDEATPFLKRPSSKEYDVSWESFIADAALDVFIPILEKRRPRGNTMADVHACHDILHDEEWMLKRDVPLRICFLMKKAYRTLDRDYFDQMTREIPEAKYAEYKKEKNRLVVAATVEVWKEFFTNPDVSYANEGIRSDWLKATETIADGKKRINHSHHTRVTRLDVLPYHQYKIWCYELFAVVLDVHYNYKIMYNNYTAKYHHCRWAVDSSDPKLNIINHGDNMGGKSYILKNVKKTCPSMVGDMVTQITDKAFNVDRNLNDMLIIIEEMENKYLGIVPGMKGGSSGGTGESDALAFFKNRLTSGISAVIHFFVDEEHDNRRDCKQAKSSCQGNYLCATNAKLADADKHLLTRFTLQSVPKSFGDKKKDGPKPGSGNVKPQFGTEKRQHDIMYEEHKDVHRLYYFVEQCIKANVLNNNAYGATIDSAQIMINAILNKMHQDFGIPTNDGRKRNSILEMARCMCIAFACWNAFTSPVLRHYQYDPGTGEYIGINPRMIIRGVFPFLVITKDMVIDALTSLSGLWQHDHLKNVLKSIIVSTNLQKPIAGKYRLVTESELDASSNDNEYNNNGHNGSSGNKGKSGNPLSPSAIGAARAASGAMGDMGGDQGRTPMRSRGNMVGIGVQNGVPVYINAVPDHNYVSLVERTYDTIYKFIAKQLGEFQISSNDIEKILRELSEETFDIAIRSYALSKGVDTPNGPSYGSLELDTSNNVKTKAKIVIIDTCPKTRRPRVSVYIPYLKEQVPDMLEDGIVQDLRRFQEKSDKSDESLDEDEEEEEDADQDEDDAVVRSGNNNNNNNDDIMDYQEQPQKQRKKGSDNGNVGDHDHINDTLENLIAKLEKCARFQAKGEAPLIQSIVSCYENSTKDVTNQPPHVEEEKRKEYATIFSGHVPWDWHATADHPSSIVTADIYKASAHQIRNNNKISKEITFYDTVKSLQLRRKGTEKVVIPNYSYVSPSAVATLSIFDPLITENEIIKSTQAIYNQSSSWELREDIDFTCGKAHLANLGYEPLDPEDIRFCCINFQPFLYQIHADYSRTRLDKYKKSIEAERKARKAECKEKNDVIGLLKLKKEKNDAHLASVMCEYPLCSMLSKVNHQGDIINNTLYGRDSNSVIFHEMLLANSKSMKQDFVLQNSNVIRGKKRVEFKDSEAKEKAIAKARLIYTNRLGIKQKSTSKNLHKSMNKRHHTGVSKSKANHLHATTELLQKATQRMTATSSGY